MEKRSLLSCYMPIIIGVGTAEVYLLYCSSGGMNMDIASVIAIVVALLGAASGIWAQVVQFKRDSKRIDDVNNHVGTVKSDTSESRPIITGINENVKKIRDEVVEKVVPDMKKLSGVDTLVEAYKIEQAFKQNYSPNIYDKDVLKGTIDLVYEENARLQVENRSQRQQLQMSNLEINRLRDQVGSLKEELEIYKPQRHRKNDGSEL